MRDIELYIQPALVHGFQFSGSSYNVLGRNYLKELKVGLSPLVFYKINKSYAFGKLHN